MADAQDRIANALATSMDELSSSVRRHAKPAFHPKRNPPARSSIPRGGSPRCMTVATDVEAELEVFRCHGTVGKTGEVPEQKSSRVHNKRLHSFNDRCIVVCMNELDAIRSLAALAHAQRLRVFRALVVAGSAGLTPSVMADGLDVARNALSFHLKELLHAGLVTVEQQGRNLIYRAAYDQMNGLLAYLTENCCSGKPCAVPAESTTCAC